MREEYIQNASAQSLSQRAGRFTRNILGFFMPLLEVIKIVIASVASVVLLGISCVTLAGTAVALVVTAPLYLLFSPVLVPATIATAVITTGLASGGGMGGIAFEIVKRIVKKRLGIGSMSLAHNPEANRKRKGDSKPKSRAESMISKIPVVGDRLAGEDKSKDKDKGRKSQGGKEKSRGKKGKSGKKDKSKNKRGHGGGMSGSEGGMSSGSGGGMSGSDGGMSSGSGGGMPRGGRGHGH